MTSYQHDIILFDGVCNLCNGAVTFIIKRDSKNQFKFAAIQSEAGKKLLTQHQIDTELIDSIILIRGDHAFVKASAALRIAQKMSGLWPLLFSFIIIPKFLSNAIYDWVARNRYKWFGKKESCMIPTNNLVSKFLE